MLDYLKKANKIIIFVLFLLTISCVSSNGDKKDSVLSDENMEKILSKDVSDYIVDHVWDFNGDDYTIEVTEIENILKDNGLTFDNYFVMIKKYRGIHEEGKYFYVITVGVILRGIENSYVGGWILKEGKNILEEIKKFENDSISEI
jgi:hypothetical protein